MRLRQEEEEKVEMEMSPMIDIIFQLIIFFMLTTTFAAVESELKSDLPAVSTEVQERVENVIITITEGGRVLVEGKEYDSRTGHAMPQLTAMLRSLRMFFEDQAVVIKADKEASHQRVIDVLNACAGAQINNVSFMEQ